MASILVCDDELSHRQLLEIMLRKDGHKVETVGSGEAAKKKIQSALYDVIVTDIRMQPVDGIDVLKFARQTSPDTAVVMMTAGEEVEPAIEAIRAGASDYVIKKGDIVEPLRVAIAQTLETLNLRRQNFALRRDAARRNSLDNLVGSSAVMEKLKQTIRTIAPTTSNVFIYGESGTGKELVAQGIHACSARAGPFLSINCSAFPETLLESELFGYLKGAFTGATQNKRGLFEEADTGTLFLDEISEMNLGMQVKLLRVLQERLIRPLGAVTETPIDVRVVAATNRDLNRLVTDGAFREDLYYRLAVIPLQVPPLRERREDVPLLANHFFRKYVGPTGKPITKIAAQSLEQLTAYEWPGNVRQLENTIERAVALETGNELHLELPQERSKVRAPGDAGSPAVPPEGIDMERYVAEVERTLITSALKQSGGVQTRAAELLKLSYRSFRHLVKKYGI
ncbi:MAG: sigma-54 dependent transcriptional regulator [Acidobacteria bacterium]|nr:sigma-54 dependent transcriptional regulator [Acidobacteriota bacterium]